MPDHVVPRLQVLQELWNSLGELKAVSINGCCSLNERTAVCLAPQLDEIQQVATLGNGSIQGNSPLQDLILRDPFDP